MACGPGSQVPSAIAERHFLKMISSEVKNLFAFDKLSLSKILSTIDLSQLGFANLLSVGITYSSYA